MNGLYCRLFPHSMPRCAAFVGAGGKTTAIACAAGDLASMGHRVKVAATTRIFPFTPGGPLISVHGVPVDGGKLGPPENMEALLEDGSFLLVEADGAHMRPLKMTASYEPVVPSFADAVVAVAGMSCIGRPLGAVCHRPELASAFLGKDFRHLVTPGDVAALLEECYVKKVSLGFPEAELVVLLNQADDESKLEAAREVSKRLAGVRCVTASLIRAC